MTQNEYDTLKNNLHVFNRILKKTIHEAQIQYYDKLFEQYKSDIKKNMANYIRHHL